MREININIFFNNGMNTIEKVTANNNESAIIKVLRDIKLLDGEEVVGIKIIS